MMKHFESISKVVFTVVLSCTVCAFGYDWSTNPGSGDPCDPYQISTAEQLMSIGSDPNLLDKAFILMNDIDLDPNLPGNVVFDRAVIAPDTDPCIGYFQGTAFSGVFDGAGYVIHNLTIDEEGVNLGYLGLFGYLLEASIEYLGLENTSIYGTGSLVGGLCGFTEDSSIMNCYSTGSVTGRNCVGGLIGRIASFLGNQNIRNCYAMGVVSGISDVGGLIGYHHNGEVNRCYSTASVIGDHNHNYVGGLCGKNQGGIIKNSYSTGSVTGDGGSVGGLCGKNAGWIDHCYSVGSVIGNNEVGGLCGRNYESILSSYFLDTAGPDNGLGEPLTDTQLKQQVNFVDWNFIDIWAICEGTNYPRLQWQIPAADFACPDGVAYEDYSLLAGMYGIHNTNPLWEHKYDLEADGIIDWADMQIFAQHWLEGR